MRRKYLKAESEKSAYEQIKEGIENEIKKAKVESLRIHFSIQ